MNSKIIKLAVGLIILGAISAVVATLFWQRQPGGSQNPNSGNNTTPLVPVLEKQQEESLKKFVENFIILYNTYRYEDYSNLEALGDYMTENAQKQTQELVLSLRDSVPEGLVRTAKLDYGSWKLRSLPNDIYEVTVSLNISEELSQISSSQSLRDPVDFEQKSFGVNAVLQTVSYGKGWLVNSIQMSPK